VLGLPLARPHLASMACPLWSGAGTAMAGGFENQVFFAIEI